MMATTEAPRIYVACLASYNSGRLHGEWIDCDQSADEIREEIAEMLAASPEAGAEEWAIHDYEGFHGLQLSESEDIDAIAQLAETIGEHGEAYALYADHIGDHAVSVEDFQDAYGGEWDSEQAYAEDLIDQCYDLDSIMGHLAHYFDYDAFTRDLFIGDMFSLEASDGGVHVFRR